MLHTALRAIATSDGHYLVHTAENVKCEGLLAIKNAILEDLVSLERVGGPSPPAGGTLASMPLLGNILAVLLDGVKVERAKVVRLAVFEAVRAVISGLAGSAPDDGPATNNLKAPCPWRMAQMFPGTFAVLFRVAIDPDIKQGSKVTAAAVGCVVAVLRACTADRIMVNAGLLERTQPSTKSVMDRLVSLVSGTGDSSATPPPASQLAAGWDPSWLTLCNDKICPRVQELLNRCAVAPHWRVRQAGVALSALIVSHCRRSLQPCAMDALEALLIFEDDPMECVSTPAAECVARCTGSGGVGRAGALALRSRCWSALSALPRYVLPL